MFDAIVDLVAFVGNFVDSYDELTTILYSNTPDDSGPILLWQNDAGVWDGTYSYGS
jgi:hypothetical protein